MVKPTILKKKILTDSRTCTLQLLLLPPFFKIKLTVQAQKKSKPDFYVNLLCLRCSWIPGI